MPSPSPFLDPDSGAYDFARIRDEAAPIAKLVILIGAIALVPIVLLFVFGSSTPLALLLTLVTQFILAVGAALVLIHVIVRALQLANQDAE